jgi:hypothetical protein
MGPDCWFDDGVAIDFKTRADFIAPDYENPFLPPTEEWLRWQAERGWTRPHMRVNSEVTSDSVELIFACGLRLAGRLEPVLNSEGNSVILPSGGHVLLPRFDTEPVTEREAHGKHPDEERSYGCAACLHEADVLHREWYARHAVHNLMRNSWSSWPSGIVKFTNLT